MFLVINFEIAINAFFRPYVSWFIILYRGTTLIWMFPSSLFHSTISTRTRRRKNRRGRYFCRLNALDVTADQSACEMSSAEKNKAYLFFFLLFFSSSRSHRNIYFTSLRYDLGRAEEPLFRAFFSVSYLFFFLSSKPHIINHILLSSLRTY